MKMKVSHITALICFSFLTSVIVKAEPTEQEKAEIDSLTYLAAANYTNDQCLRIANLVHYKSVKCGYDLRARSAINLKAGYYGNHGLTKELEALHDSIEHDERYIESQLSSYSYVTKCLIDEYVPKLRFRSAINAANKLYALSQPKETDDEQMARERLMLRADVASVLVYIYYANNEYDEAKKYAGEVMELCAPLTSDNIATYMSTLSSLSMMAEYHGSLDEQVSVARDLAYGIEKYKELSQSTETSVYDNYLQRLYVCISIGQNNKAEAKRNMAVLKDLLDASQEMRPFNEPPYLYCLSKYYSYIHEYDKVLSVSDSLIAIGNEGMVYAAYREKCRAAFLMGNIDLADSLYDRVIADADSALTRNIKSALEDLSIIMDKDKLEYEKEQMQTRQNVLVLVMAIIVLSGIVILVLVVSAMNRKRINERQRILSEQNDRLEAEVERQTKELRVKNQEITDSINYAFRIQKAILPDIKKFTSFGVEGAFVFFKPLNIVSGDFYWSRMGGELLFVCADCTGHGVPGAFMSMIGSAILNDVSSNEELLPPGEMLERLDERVVSMLNQNEENYVHDGMDLSIVAYNPTTRRLRSSSARRPIYLFRSGELLEIHGTKRSIGDRDPIIRNKAFETFETVVSPGETLYISSDGFADQFGGITDAYPRGRRLKSSGFRDFLKKLNTYPIGEQQSVVESFYATWSANCDQLDDISLLGVRF